MTDVPNGRTDVLTEKVTRSSNHDNSNVSLNIMFYEYKCDIYKTIVLLVWLIVSLLLLLSAIASLLVGRRVIVVDRPRCRVLLSPSSILWHFCFSCSRRCFRSFSLLSVLFRHC